MERPYLQPQRILIVKLGAIGDVVNSLPLACRLRAGLPQARISWAIAPAAHALVAGHAAVDEFLIFEKSRPAAWPAFVRQLRARRCDLALDLQRLFKSGLIARLSGARWRLGFDRARCKEGSASFCNLHLPPNAAPGVTVEQYLEFADFLGLPAQTPRFDLPIEPCDAPAPGETRVVVNVGASKSANRWGTARWAELCARLVRELGASVELTGGAEDRPAVDEVRRLAGVPLTALAGALSLKQTAGRIAAAQLFVGCDTGPLHIAVALGTPVVALYGASDPRRTGPFGQAEAVVSRPAPCSPCRQRDCTVAGHPCMQALGVAQVFELSRERLAVPGRAGRAP